MDTKKTAMMAVIMLMAIMASDGLAQTVILHPQTPQSGWVYAPQPVPSTAPAWTPYTAIPMPSVPAPVIILQPDGTIGTAITSNDWTVVLDDD